MGVSRSRCLSLRLPPPHRVGVVAVKPDVRKLRQAVTDDMWDHFPCEGPNADWFIATVEEPMLDLICHYEGHVVSDDMCMKPEHRFCTTCNKMTPNEPVTEL